VTWKGIGALVDVCVIDSADTVEDAGAMEPSIESNTEPI
jgi:hypothetical protein